MVLTRVWASLMVAALVGLCGCEPSFTAIEGGRPVADVILPDEPNAAEKLAAEELAYHLGKACGTAPTVLSEGEAAKSRAKCHFLVGATRAAKAAGLSADGLPMDGSRALTKGNCCFLFGRDIVKKTVHPRQTASLGTLYAVYDFLEREMGVRWLWPGELGEVVPKRTELTVALDRTGEKLLQKRNWYPCMGWDKPTAPCYKDVANLKKFYEDEKRFMIRHRVSRHTNSELGHAFYTMWKTYGKEHPEWFNLLPDGTRRPLGHDRTGGNITLCVSNPDLHRQIAKDWFEKYRKTRQAEGDVPFPMLPWISCCENDTPGCCTCDNCRAWDAPDPRFARHDYWNKSGRMPLITDGIFQKLSGTDIGGGHVGGEEGYPPVSISDRYAKFYNAVLAEARKLCPEVRGYGYAYANYTEAPRETKVDPGVIIEFVPSRSVPFGKAESDHFRRNWLGWEQAGAKDIHLRPNYMIGGALFPIDRGRYIVGDINFTVKHGLDGIFMDSGNFFGAARAMELYSVIRCMKNPAQTYDASRAEFLSAFGPAKDAIGRYLDTVEHVQDPWADGRISKIARIPENCRSDGVPSGGMNAICAELFDDTYFTTLLKLLDEATSAAKGETLVERRIDYLRKGVTYARKLRLARVAFKAQLKDKRNTRKAAAWDAAKRDLEAYRAAIEADGVCDLTRAWRVTDAGKGDGIPLMDTLEGWKIPPKWTAVQGAGRDGSTAFVWENDDPNFYQFVSKKVPLKPGRKYEYGVYVKYENLGGGGQFGPAVGFESSTKDGKYLGCQNATGLRGTTKNWQLVTGTGVVATNAAETSSFLMFVPRQLTGKVWFADPWIREVQEPPVTRVYSTAYRNTAADEDVEFFAVFDDCEMRRVKKPVSGEFVFETPKGQKKVKARVDDERAWTTLNASELKLGPQTVSLVLNDADGAFLDKKDLPFTHLAKFPVRKVALDTNGRLLVCGKPVFPVAMYTSAIQKHEDWMPLVGKSDFDFIIEYQDPTKETMDRLAQNGVKVMYNVDVYEGTSGGFWRGIRNREERRAFVAKKVKEFANHPALFGWYINDEFEFHDRVRDTCLQLAELDPEHPCLSVICQADRTKNFLGTFDILGDDCYPLHHDSLSRCDKEWGAVKKGTFGKFPFWGVVQAFATKKSKRLPSLDEYRSMAWTAIANGANGVVFWVLAENTGGLAAESYHGTKFEEAWADVAKVAGSIKKAEPILLSAPGPAPKARPEGATVRTFVKDGRLYVLAVETKGAPHKLSLDFDGFGSRTVDLPAYGVSFK